ncbi:MAG: PKD domain-containing protein [Fibrobacterota bacterium]
MKTLLLFLLAGSLYAGEQVLCSFEHAEMAAWIDSSRNIWDGFDFDTSTTKVNNDTEKVYRCVSGVMTPIVSFQTRKSPANATNGEWTLFHPIYSSGAPNEVLIRSHAEWFQNWLGQGGLVDGGYLDSNHIPGDYDGPVDYSVNRYCTLFGLFRLIDRLPTALQDWSGYDYLYVDVKSTSATIDFWLRFEGRYRPSNRCQYRIQPGQYYTLRLPIKQMAWLSNEDMTDVKDFTLQLRNTTGPTNIYIDNIRLVTADVASALPVVDPDSKLLAPWLLTTQYKPPVEPVPATPVLQRTTGAISASSPVLVTPWAANIRDDPSRLQNLRHGLVALDNNRYAAMDQMKNYQYWAGSYYGGSPVPSLTNGNSNRGWLGSVDGGQTWKSDAIAQSYPLQFSVYSPITNRGTVVAWGFSDNMLRGYGYFGMMHWCQDYADGSGFSSYITFFRLQPGTDRWEVYPHHTNATAVQYPACIIASDIPRGCMGTFRMTVLPSGRIWTMLLSNHMNPTVSRFSDYISYSDDGGMRWQLPQGKKSAVWRNGQAEPIIGYSPDYLVNYQGKVLAFGQNSATLYYTMGNENDWTNWTSIPVSVGYDNAMTSAVTYKDSVIFACLKNGGGSFLRKSAGKDTLANNISGVTSMQQLITLVGERVWYIWAQGNRIKCRKYFIHENRWTDSMTLVQNDSTILDLRIPQVSPPSHVPIEWRENAATSGSYNLKLARIPIDAEEAVLDPDYDGFDNGSETAYGTDPGNPDSDNDGLWDGQEVCLLTTDPKKADTDDDGDNDGVEFYAFTNPKDVAKTATHNQAPVISVKDSTVGNTVYLDANATTDNESDWLRYFWEIDRGGGDTVKAEGSRIIYTFADPTPRPARLIVDDGRGNRVESSLFIFSGNERTGKDNLSAAVLAVQPNPFNPSTTLRYGLASQQVVCLEIYNISGRLIRQLVNGVEKPGIHSVVWNGCDSQNRQMGSALYLIKLKAGNQEIIKQGLLIK